MKDYIEQEGTEAVDYLMNDSEEFVNSENNKFKVSMKPITTHETTHETTYEELGKQALGPNSKFKVVFPGSGNDDKQNNDER